MPRKSNFALRLPASLKSEAEQAAKEEGTTPINPLTLRWRKSLRPGGRPNFFMNGPLVPTRRRWTGS